MATQMTHAGKPLRRGKKVLLKARKFFFKGLLDVFLTEFPKPLEILVERFEPVKGRSVGSRQVPVNLLKRFQCFEPWSPYPYHDARNKGDSVHNIVIARKFSFGSGPFFQEDQSFRLDFFTKRAHRGLHPQGPKHSEFCLRVHVKHPNATWEKCQ